MIQQTQALDEYPRWGLAKDHPWWKWVNQTVRTQVPQVSLVCLVCAGPRVPTKPLLATPVPYDIDHCDKEFRETEAWKKHVNLLLAIKCTCEMCHPADTSCRRKECSYLPAQCNYIQQPMCSAECLLMMGNRAFNDTAIQHDCSHFNWPYMPDNVAPPPHIIRKDALFECYLKPGEKNDPHLGHWTQCKTITHVIDNGREIQLNTSTECRIAGMCLNGRLLEVQDIAIADKWGWWIKSYTTCGLVWALC